jgi:hypothetical protein
MRAKAAEGAALFRPTLAKAMVQSSLPYAGMRTGNDRMPWMKFE